MAHNNKFVVFALFFFAIVGMASAEAASAASAEANATAAEAPADNSVVGTLDGGATTTAAPVGGPIPSSVYESLSPAGTPDSGATIVGASAAAATVVAATVATSFFF